MPGSCNPRRLCQLSLLLFTQEFARGSALLLPGCSLPSLAEKPRLLVCAPSNAAADELLQRVMGGGFIGNDGRTYFPNVVR